MPRTSAKLLKDAEEYMEQHMISHTPHTAYKLIAELSAKLREMEWHKTYYYYDNMGWYKNIPETKQPEEGSRVWVEYDYDLCIATIHSGDFLINGKDIGEVSQWSPLIEPEPPIRDLPKSDYELTKGDWDKRLLPTPPKKEKDHDS